MTPAAGSGLPLLRMVVRPFAVKRPAKECAFVKDPHERRKVVPGASSSTGAANDRQGQRLGVRVNLGGAAPTRRAFGNEHPDAWSAAGAPVHVVDGGSIHVYVCRRVGVGEQAKQQRAD